MRLIMFFILGIIVANAWNNPDMVNSWITQASQILNELKAQVHAATE